MLCYNKNPYSRVGKTFEKLSCSSSNCVYCQKPQLFDFEFIRKQINNKNTKHYQVYQKIVQLYDSAIKCLEMDRNRLLQMMKQQTTYQFNHAQKKLEEFFQCGRSSLNTRDEAYLQYLFSTESFQQNIKKQFVGFEEKFQEMFMNIRQIWIPDLLEGLEETNKLFKEQRQDKIKTWLLNSTYILGNQQILSSPNSLINLKEVALSTKNVSEFELISLFVFAPQIQSISLENSYRHFENLQSILKVLFRMKQLRTLKIQVNRPLNHNFKEICETVRHLELERCNSQTVLSFSKHFPEVVELVLDGITQTSSSWDFSYFQNLRKLKFHPFQRIKTIQNLKSLKNIEYLDISGNIFHSDNFSSTKILEFKQLKSLAIPTSILEAFLQATNLVHLNLNIPNYWDSRISEQETLNNICNFIQKSSQLKSLWLQNGSGINLDYESILSNLPHLRLLFWSNQTQFQLINSISNHQTQLLYLNLKCCFVGDRGAMAIQKHLTKLIFLKLCNIGNIGIAYISKIKTLESLVFSANHLQYNQNSRCNKIKILTNSKNLKNFKDTNPSNGSSIFNFYKVLRNEVILINRTLINDKKHHPQTLIKQMNNIELMKIQFNLDGFQPNKVFDSPNRYAPRVYAPIRGSYGRFQQPRFQQPRRAREFRNKQYQIKKILFESRSNYISKKVFSQSKFSYTNQF